MILFDNENPPKCRLTLHWADLANQDLSVPICEQQSVAQIFKAEPDERYLVPPTVSRC